MKKRILITGTALMFFAAATADKNGPGGDYTGAPLANGNAGNTCSVTNCHDDGSNLGGTLSLKFTEKGQTTAITTFKTGKTYTVTVNVAGSSASKFGFSATLLDPNRLKTGTTNGAGSGAKIVTLSSRSIAMHNAPSTTGVFTFDWTPPASPADSVILYAAGNASNGDNARFGDQILKTKMTLHFDKTASVKIEPKPEFSFFPNPATEFLQLNKAVEKVVVYDLNGSIVLTAVLTDRIDIQSLAAEVYLLQITDCKNTVVVKFVKD